MDDSDSKVILKTFLQKRAAPILTYWVFAISKFNLRGFLLRKKTLEGNYGDSCGEATQLKYLEKQSIKTLFLSAILEFIYSLSFFLISTYPYSLSEIILSGNSFLGKLPQFAAPSRLHCAYISNCAIVVRE